MNAKFFLLAVLFLSRISYSQYYFKHSEKANLNSDYIIDKIELTGDDMDYTLTINGISIKGSFEVENMTGFEIIDIDKQDFFQEIAVHASGPSDDDVFNIYWFNGKKIIFMNSLGQNPTFNGNGIVYNDSWQGFWMKRDKYILNKKNHKLKFVPQFAYFVGINNIVVKDWIAIYSDKELTKKIATLSKNSKIEILICNTNNSNNENDYLYLIKSKSKLIGWVKSDILQKNCSGFHYAD